MTFKSIAGLFMTLLAMGLSGCRNTVTSPTAAAAPPMLTPQPTARPPDYAVADATLSGVVFELTPTGRVPIAGLVVSNGEGESTTTDANGFFSLKPLWVCPCTAQPWIDAGITLLWLWTDNDYVDPPGQPPSLFTRGMTNPGPGWRDVAINGDTRVELELVRR